MKDPRQIRLFEASAGEVAPPEEGLYLGTCGWSYADWEGTVYPPGTPPAGRLAEYAKYFATVEIDATFYGTPRRSVVERWREVAPEGFLFAAKFPQGVLYTSGNPILLARAIERVEAVGYLYPGAVVLVAAHVDPIYQQLREFKSLLERLLGVLFDLRYALSERQEPRLGALGRQLVLGASGEIGFNLPSIHLIA